MPSTNTYFTRRDGRRAVDHLRALGQRVIGLESWPGVSPSALIVIDGKYGRVHLGPAEYRALVEKLRAG